MRPEWVENVRNQAEASGAAFSDHVVNETRGIELGRAL